MTHFFGRLFNIRPTEWPRLLFLYLMIFVYIVGATWGETTVAAAFLQHVGVEFLPWVFVIIAIASVLATAIYTAFADRVANNKLMIAILAIGILGVAAGRILLEWDNLVTIVYPLLYLIMYVPLSNIFTLNYHNLVNSFYDIRSAKRIVPVLSTASRTASIFAGMTMHILNRFLAPGSIIMVWLSALVTVALLAWLMPYLLKEERERPGDVISSGTVVSTRQQRLSYFDNIREGYGYVSQSSFLRWMAVHTLLLMVLMAFLQFRTDQILQTELETMEKISNFTAFLTWVTNLIVLPIQLFLLSRIIGRIGLNNAILIFPLGTLAACGGLIFASSLSTAALAHFDRNAFRVAFHGAPDNLLYNAVQLRVKGRARAFVGGLIAPVGSLIGGLLLKSPLRSVPGFLSASLGTLAVAYIAGAVVIRKKYAQALIKMLEQEDFSFLLWQQASDLTVADPTTLAQLQKKLEESSSHEMTVFMAQLISQVGGGRVISILDPAIRATEDARTRSAMVDVLVAAELDSDAVRQLYTDLLADPDGRVRQSAIAGLEQVTAPTDKGRLSDPQFLAQMLEMIRDPDIGVCSRALLALVRSGDFYRFTPAVKVLNQLLADEDPGRRVRGARVLGQIHDRRAIQNLLKCLSDPADEVRLEAAVAIESLSQDRLPSQVNALEIVIKMIGSLKDPVERIRRAALTILGRLGARESHQAMVNALTDSSPQVRATAVDALAQAGQSIIPTIRPQLDSPDPQLRKMAAVVLSRVNPREFSPLVLELNVMENLLSIYRNYSLVEALAKLPSTEHPSIAVLQSTLRERNQQLADEIFYLLTAIYDPGDVKIISESLRSENPRVRANATEALESLTSPQAASLVTPLFDPELSPAQLLALGQDTWDIAHPDTAQAIQQLVANPDVPWLRAITTYALGEIGAAQSTPAHTPTPHYPFTLTEVEAMLEILAADPVDEVRAAAQAARRMMTGHLPVQTGQITSVTRKEGILLSTIEKVIFLKEVPFFQDMTIDQLKVLANACEEELFETNTRIFEEGDGGGVLYVVVSGRVAIERQGRRKGSIVRLATLEAHACFGEMTLFDKGPRSAAAVAIQDTLTLRLRREPLIALARQYPDLSLELIHVLSQRLREANDRITQLTRGKPRELQKLYDQFD